MASSVIPRVSSVAVVLVVALVLVVCSSVSASSPGDVSHRRCLYKNWSYLGNGVQRLSLMNICSCDLNVQYTTYNYTGFQTSTARVPAWTGTTKVNNNVMVGYMSSGDIALGGTQASKADCMPNLRYCLSAFPYFNGAAILNQCNVDVALQIPLGSLGPYALPIYVQAWNGTTVGPNQLPNNAAVLPSLSFSLSLNTLRARLAVPRLSFSGYYGFTVIQRSASAKADDHSFELF